MCVNICVYTLISTGLPCLTTLSDCPAQQPYGQIHASSGRFHVVPSQIQASSELERCGAGRKWPGSNLELSGTDRLMSS